VADADGMPAIEQRFPCVSVASGSLELTAPASPPQQSAIFIRADVAEAPASLSYFLDFRFDGFRRRTPGPPPFSAMKSTPAMSIATHIF
jgi:hypothetical protein